jgi:hypothetical protein
MSDLVERINVIGVPVERINVSGRTVPRMVQR